MFTVEELKLIDSFLPSTNEAGEVKAKIEEMLNQLKDYNLCLWSFHWDCGRQGNLEGVFKATKEDVKNVIGYEAYFGEVLGKHSEVYGTIEEGEITLISDDPIRVMSANTSGFNPLNYIHDIEYYIKGLDINQLKKFGEANDHVIESDDFEEVKESIVEYYKGSDGDELSYARECVLGLLD